MLPVLKALLNLSHPQKVPVLIVVLVVLYKSMGTFGMGLALLSICDWLSIPACSFDPTLESVL